MKKPKKKPEPTKPTLEQAISFAEFRLEGLKRQYERLSKEYAHCVQIGVGLTAISILDTLRSLAFLYTDIAAHEHAIRSMKVDIHNQ